MCQTHLRILFCHFTPVTAPSSRRTTTGRIRNKPRSKRLDLRRRTISNLRSSRLLTPGTYATALIGKNNLVGTGLNEIYDLEPWNSCNHSNRRARQRTHRRRRCNFGLYTVPGNQPQSLLLRALGPSLAGYGVAAALADPTLELHTGDGTLIATNDNWKDTQEAEIIATGIPPTNDLESAILVTLDPGAYTMVVSGKNGGTGVTFAEVYTLPYSGDLMNPAPVPIPSPSPTPTPPSAPVATAATISLQRLTAIGQRLPARQAIGGPTPTPHCQRPTPVAKSLNISTRAKVEVGENVMIGGFIITGDAPKKVIVRAIGPSLAPLGVNGALADPVLELHGPDGSLIASDDNWKDNPDQALLIQASGIPPQNDLESAIVATLTPAGYTAIVSGKNDTSGVALVEVYDLDQNGDSQLANIRYSLLCADRGRRCNRWIHSRWSGQWSRRDYSSNWAVSFESRRIECLIRSHFRIARRKWDVDRV